MTAAERKVRERYPRATCVYRPHPEWWEGPRLEYNVYTHGGLLCRVIGEGRTESDAWQNADERTAALPASPGAR